MSLSLREFYVEFGNEKKTLHVLAHADRVTKLCDNKVTCLRYFLRYFVFKQTEIRYLKVKTFLFENERLFKYLVKKL